MDEKPFLRLDLQDVDPYTLPELKKLTKDAFDLDSVLLAAEELKYVSALKRAIADQFNAPSDDFVKLLAGKVYEGTYTQKVRELFNRLAGKALTQFVNDRVNDRLKSALGGTVPKVGAEPDGGDAADEPQTQESETVTPDVDTTMEEIEGFQIVRAIVASEVPFDRVVPRDSKSYFAVLLDDNNRKPICRLHFNRKQRYVGIFDEDKVETREPIDKVEDIYRFAEGIRETVRRYV